MFNFFFRSYQRYFSINDSVEAIEHKPMLILHKFLANTTLIVDANRKANQAMAKRKVFFFLSFRVHRKRKGANSNETEQLSVETDCRTTLIFLHSVQCTHKTRYVVLSTILIYCGVYRKWEKKRERKIHTNMNKHLHLIHNKTTRITL